MFSKFFHLYQLQNKGNQKLSMVMLAVGNQKRILVVLYYHCLVISAFTVLGG